jgi:uncharacterized repeat protein (TIGR03803 family)
MHRGPLQANDIYDNGPINGNTDAWTINFGFVVSDTFTVPSDGANITGAAFGMWLFSGDTLTSAELSITSGENGGTSYFDQTVNFTQGSCTVNQYGYNVCTVTTSFTGPALNAGTYWVNLQNASVPSGDPVYWDENSGPSSASQNEVGTIPSESFTILGSATTTTTTSSTTGADPCPSPQSGFRDLHDFAPGSNPSGLTVGPAAKLYGTLADAGSQGAGLLYSLAQMAGQWFVNSLYNFLGGSSGSSPNSVIVGPGGVLYGSAAGGIQECAAYGGTYCGLIYEAKPGPAACATAACGLEQTTLYEFTGFSDAWGGTVSAIDSAGNLYGISIWGGTNGNGALFELSPSPGGWTETILHSFTGGADGGLPSSLLMGHDGNLYGTAWHGGTYGSGVIFQFVPSGSGWTENDIYSFTGGTDGWYPDHLIQDGPGNFYVIAVCNSWGYGECNVGGNYDVGVIGSLSHTAEGWVFGQIHVAWSDECNGSYYTQYQGLALGRAGHLYATEEGGIFYYCSGVFDVDADRLIVWGPPGFANLTSDANGNLYGTMAVCSLPYGNNAMVWEISP